MSPRAPRQPDGARIVDAATSDPVRRGDVDRLLEIAGEVEIEDASPDLRAADRRI